MLVTEYERVGLVVLLVSKFVATILRSPPRDSSQYMSNVGKIKWLYISNRIFKWSKSSKYQCSQKSEFFQQV